MTRILMKVLTDEFEPEIPKGSHIQVDLNVRPEWGDHVIFKGPPMHLTIFKRGDRRYVESDPERLVGVVTEVWVRAKRFREKLEAA